MAKQFLEVDAQACICKNCVGGEWIPSAGKKELLYSPATAAPMAEVPYSTPEEIDQAVQAADTAFASWRARTVNDRMKILFRYHALLEHHEDELASLITLENGKTLEESRGSVLRGIEAVQFACGIPTLMAGEALEGVGKGVDCVLIRQPLGVCVGIPHLIFRPWYRCGCFPWPLRAGIRLF